MFSECKQMAFTLGHGTVGYTNGKFVSLLQGQKCLSESRFMAAIDIDNNTSFTLRNKPTIFPGPAIYKHLRHL
jgi:hypothetical protein